MHGARVRCQRVKCVRAAVWLRATVGVQQRQMQRGGSLVGQIEAGDAGQQQQRWSMHFV